MCKKEFLRGRESEGGEEFCVRRSQTGRGGKIERVVVALFRCESLRGGEGRDMWAVARAPRALGTGPNPKLNIQLNIHQVDRSRTEAAGSGSNMCAGLRMQTATSNCVRVPTMRTGSAGFGVLRILCRLQSRPGLLNSHRIL